MDDFTWMSQAACKGQTDKFFPETGNLDAARKICAGCPVQFECEEYGHIGINLPLGTNRGLWGGKTPDELLWDERAAPTTKPYANPVCDEHVSPRRNGRGRPRQYCSHRCYKMHHYAQNRILDTDTLDT